MKRNYASKLNALTVKVFFIASVIFAFNLTAIAQEPSHRVTFKNGSISYQGVQAGDLVFNLKLENTHSKKIIVQLLNDAGEKIFSRGYYEKNLSKNFMIPSEIETVTFVIRDVSAKTEQKFKITTAERYVEEMSVKKVL